MGKRDGLIRAYMEALPIRRLLVLSCPGGRPARIASDPVKNLDIAGSFHFGKPQHAELVHAHCLRDFEGIGALRGEGWIELPAFEVRDRIADIARYLGAQVRQLEEVEREATAAVDRILASVEDARKSGGLAQVNAAYKAYRQAQVAKGEAAITYSVHLANFTRSLVVAAAKNGGAGRNKVGESFRE